LNANVTRDGAKLPMGHKLLAQKKGPIPMEPNDPSDEELTHVFIGDLGVCTLEADAHKTKAAGTLDDPACGRSGRNVRIFQCTEAGVEELPPAQAVACHVDSSCLEGVLQVTDLLLTDEKDPANWTDLFRKSFLSGGCK